MDDSEASALVRYLQTHKTGTLRWGCDQHLIGLQGFWGWVDILQPELQRELGLGWIWTIDTPVWSKDSGVTTLGVEPDLVVVRLGDPTQPWTEHLEFARSASMELDVHEAEYAASYLAKHPEHKMFVEPGWTYPLISQKLSDWCQEYADKRWEFVFDPAIKTTSEYPKRVSSMYNLGEGWISDAEFDAQLAKFLD